MPRSASLLFGTWPAIIAAVAQSVDLEATARQFNALQRKRKIQTAEALLRLALMWGVGGLSLREAAALASEAGIAELSDKAVEGRLRKMGDWLAHILATLLADRISTPNAAAGTDLALSLVDGSVICAPGKGQDWRLHARYDPGRGRFADLVLTTTREAEAAGRTRICPGRVLIMDRGYARVRNFKAVLADGGDFITRLSWGSVKLYDAKGKRIDVTALLADTSQTREVPVWVKGIPRAFRLVIQPLPAEAAGRQRAKRIRKANRNGHKINARTIEAAGFLMLLTSLAVEAQPAARIAELYRNRWQVEIGIKRLKTLGGLDELRSADPVLARTWLLTQLIAAVLTDDLANQIVGIPPRRSEAPAAPQSMWRAWARARDILLDAIVPRPKLNTRAALIRFRSRLAEPPRRRCLQACQIRPP
jgi:Transposase DDE domain